MRVKVGNKIHDANNEPIMVILSNKDKENIANMPGDATKYCSYPDINSTEEIRNFMKIPNNGNS